ncbi:phenylalanyl-tRNA synthetase beta subunit [Neolewinella xylanilytica]|uniref:Phenylalanine--tRNA ligase beta subunit n=1 Tax=Neolewinella xylanilytica TaxID=1514080 RepID=A0A2S6I1X9_9BACT|nr:phenylalanine--tRNA ligase subunit beta [Neolewinella xylanilytica]PPK85091.1 phenylalanyl-tRNA synthetase beta subunit [Neolewinella xylanilytica]
MKVSLNWLREYIDLDISPERIGELLTGTGLEVEGMEKVESVPGGLEGVVVGHVVECGKHPNADRLSLTRVDIGTDEPVSIVCGAPNVAAGQYVPVATVGTTLHPTGNEAFTIKKGKIRGEVSEGMICAEDELGLGTGHDGIIVFDKAYTPGTPVADVYELETDYVYEIGLTPNRSDATNHLGVAFDLAAALSVERNEEVRLRQPEVTAFREGSAPAFDAQIKDPAEAPRYAGLVIDNLRVEASPDWLRARLHAIGVRPINNVVDVTNYVLHEMGQPLHAFDLDKVADDRIIVRKLPEGTPFRSLDGVERKLSADDLMICDGKEQPLCLAGVFGGADSGVSDRTTRIFLESAHFEAGTVRRSSMRHNLRTDAARIFEKGSDPNVVVYALQRAALLLQELAGGTVAGQLLDRYPDPIEPRPVEVRYRRIDELIGVELGKETVHNILRSMNMEIHAAGQDRFTVAVPTNKVDVTREVDVIEEILRVYGFNNVPEPATITTAMVVAPRPDPSALRELIGDLLAANGYLEMMALSLAESRYYAGRKDLVVINNTSNVHLDVLRPDLLYSALDAVRHNQNFSQRDLRLFEFGRNYYLEGDGYRETNHLSLTLTGRRQRESWHAAAGGEGVTFYTLKAAVELVLQRLGIDNYRSTEVPADAFAFGLRYHKGPMELVDFGAVAGAALERADVKTAVYYADFNWDHLMRVLPSQSIQVATPGKYPTVRRDLALVVDGSVAFADIERLASKAGKKLITEINLFDVYRNEQQLGAGKKSYAVSFVFESSDRTLQDKEVDKVMADVANVLGKQLGAEVRR